MKSINAEVGMTIVIPEGEKDRVHFILSKIHETLHTPVSDEVILEMLNIRVEYKKDGKTVDKSVGL